MVSDRGEANQIAVTSKKTENIYPNASQRIPLSFLHFYFFLASYTNPLYFAKLFLQKQDQVDLR